METNWLRPLPADEDAMEEARRMLEEANEQKGKIISMLADCCRRDIGDDLMDVYNLCLGGVSVEDVRGEVNRILCSPSFDRVMPTPGELLAGIMGAARRERIAETAGKDAADRAAGWSAPAAELCLANIERALKAGEISEEAYHRIRLSKVVRPSERRRAVKACQALSAEAKERILRLHCPDPGTAPGLPPGQDGMDSEAYRRGRRTGGGLRRLV